MDGEALEALNRQVQAIRCGDCRRPQGHDRAPPLLPRPLGPKAELVEFAGVGHAPWLAADTQIGVVSEFLLH